MMYVLKPNEVCPKDNSCPHRVSCWGAVRNRDTEFYCDFIEDDGSISENKIRSEKDKTGKMKIVLE